jgi:hypothetical protein
MGNAKFEMACRDQRGLLPFLILYFTSKPNMKKTTVIHSIVVFLGLVASLHAQVPTFINYQGRVSVGGTNFTGTGKFKFAIVNSDGTTTYWSNDSTSAAGSQPAAAVQLPVSKGLYTAPLGDTSTPNMAGFDTMNLGTNTDFRLRVWFDDGTHGSQLMTPDQGIGSVPFAFNAHYLGDGDSNVMAEGGRVMLDATSKVPLQQHDLEIKTDASARFRGNLFADGSLGCNGYMWTNSDMACSGNFTAKNVYAASVFAGNLVYASDRNLKEKFTAADSRAILKRVAGLQITSWNFKGDAATRHIGPMAQDFYAAFNVGTDEKHIGVVDEGGVALAAIQGLNQAVEEKDAKIKDLEGRLTKMEAKLDRLANQVGNGEK